MSTQDPAGRRVKSLAKRALGRSNLEALNDRVDFLEQELRENRELHRRISELTDVVTELLVPLAQSDREKVAEELEKYRAKI